MTDLVRIQWLDETDSTQNAFKGHLSSYDNMSVTAARLQTAGRGQRGNTWLARKGENLTFSMLLKFGGPEDFPPLAATGQFAITVAATLGVCGYLDSKGIQCAIKWPNDIYLRNKKICGMLVENVLEGGNIVASVVGIGLNVNQKDFPAQLVNPTSMSLATGKEYIPEHELELLCPFLARSFEDTFRKGIPFDGYQERLFRRNESHDFVDCSDGSTFNGVIIGARKDGKLLVRNAKGELREFAFKEISYII